MRITLLCSKETIVAFVVMISEKGASEFLISCVKEPSKDFILNSNAELFITSTSVISVVGMDCLTPTTRGNSKNNVKSLNAETWTKHYTNISFHSEGNCHIVKLQSLLFGFVLVSISGRGGRKRVAFCLNTSPFGTYDAV